MIFTLKRDLRVTNWRSIQDVYEAIQLCFAVPSIHIYLSSTISKFVGLSLEIDNSDGIFGQGILHLVAPVINILRIVRIEQVKSE
jgi:hypothetical protein